MSIRWRLTLLFTLIVALILLVLSVSMYLFNSQFRKEEHYARLREKAQTTLDFLEEKSSIELLKSIEEHNLTTFDDEEITLYDSLQHIIFDSGLDHFAISATDFQRIIAKKEVFFHRGITEAVGIWHINPLKQGRAIVISATDKYGFRKLDNLRNTLIEGTLISMLFVVLAGWFFADRALRPVLSIIKQVEDISAHNIHSRLVIKRKKDELAQLSDTFNQMLNRLETAFTQQKNFANYVAHELRTPLAVMLSQTEFTLMKERLGEQYQSALHSVGDEIRGMIKLVNDLLELAYANAEADKIQKHSLRVDEILWQARSQLLQKRKEYQIEISFEHMPDSEDDLIIKGNEALLRHAFGNVMENACKYSQNQSVKVRLDVQGRQIKIIFEDNGFGIPSEDLIHIFEPFYRSGHTNQIAGHGIGLPLTKRIIEIHEGTIDIQSVIEKGTVVKVVF